MKREPPISDVIGIVVGLGLIAWAMLPPNDIEFLPGDPRGESWFHSLVTGIAIVAGLFFAAVSAIRLIQGLRSN